MDWRKAFAGILIIAISGFAFLLVATHFSISLSAAYNSIHASEKDSGKKESRHLKLVTNSNRHNSADFLSSINTVFQDSQAILASNTATVTSPENSSEIYSPEALIYAVKFSTPSLGVVNEYYKTAEKKESDYEITPEQLTIPNSFSSKEQEKLRNQFTVLVEEP